VRGTRVYADFSAQIEPGMMSLIARDYGRSSEATLRQPKLGPLWAFASF
jgi:hypothetical protein